MSNEEDAEYSQYSEDTGEELPKLPLASEDELPEAFTRFVDGTLLEHLTGAQNAHKHYWCSRWVEHPDALHRLYAIWREWEDVQTDTMTLHDFIRNVLDWHLPYLTGENGALSRCGKEHKPHVRLDEAGH